MKNYPQTVEAKKQFKSELLDLWMEYNGGARITRWELSELWHKSDRAVRKEINRIANYFAILSNSGQEGYELVIKPEAIKDNPYALKRYVDLVDHSLAESKSRIEELSARQKPLIAVREVCKNYLAQK
jgi:hypothetical protein